ncbi:MAG: hypothetical protein OXJ54_07955 [Gemmatimonadetes bacterium]|nr:hypothetical protein [Candidatus Palauibacter rhopaloidicola]
MTLRGQAGLHRKDVNAAYHAYAVARPGLARNALLALLTKKALNDPDWFEALPPDPGPPNGDSYSVNLTGPGWKTLDELWRREWKREPGVSKATICRRIFRGVAESSALGKLTPKNQRIAQPFAGVDRIEIQREAGSC